MDTENLVIGNKLIFSRHKVSSRAHSEKKVFCFLSSIGLHGLRWKEVRIGHHPKSLWLKGKKNELGKLGSVPAPPLKAV